MTSGAGHRPSFRPLNRRSLSLVQKKSLLAASAQSNRILINVGGVRYETYRSTLRAIPDTRLFWLTESKSQGADYDSDKGEYFFDRHSGMFNTILNYYRTGELHVPGDVCGPAFEGELAFWGLDEEQIQSCCWTNYRSHRDAQQTLKELSIEADEPEQDNDEENRYIKERFGIETGDGENEVTPTCWQRYRPKICMLMEEPYSSRGAQVIAVISLMFVLLSITNFCMESHAIFRIPLNTSNPISPTWTTWEKNTKSTPVRTIVMIDYVCVFFFTIEFIIRLVFSEDKKKFFITFMNWIEIGAILPFYVERLIIFISPELEYNIYMQILKSMRLIRVFRIFKLTRHFSGLKVLWRAIKASAKELLLLIIFLFISVLIFACLVYYAESVQESPENDFKSIPLGFWWAVVTMTTLGYGDMYPRTGLGYVVGVVCSVCGVLVLALPVPVIVNNFSLYYSHAQAQMKLPKKRKRILAAAHNDLKTDFSLDEINVDNNEEDGTSQHSRDQNVSPEIKETTERQHCDTDDKQEENTLTQSITEVPGRRRSQRGINVLFVDETGSPGRRHRRTFKRKVSPIAESYKDRSCTHEQSGSPQNRHTNEVIQSDEYNSHCTHNFITNHNKGHYDVAKVHSINRRRSICENNISVQYTDVLDTPKVQQMETPDQTQNEISESSATLENGILLSDKNCKS